MVAASMAAILLIGGAPKKRYILNNSRVLIHQPLIHGTLIGPATDLDIQAREIIRLRKRLYEILAKHTGQNVDQIERDADRDKWLEANQAIEYGAVDQVLEHMPEMPKSNQEKIE